MSSATERTPIAPLQEDAPDAWPLSRVAKENLSDLAYREIRLALMRSQLKPRERLLLRPLSAKLGISATPVREALLRLVSEKALTLDARGTVVVPVLDRERLLEIRDLRVELEGRAGARAAEIATEEDIAVLEKIQDEITQCHTSEDFARALECNEQFHFAVCRMARLPVLYQIVETLWMRCGPILSHLYESGLPKWDVHPHLRVIEGIRRRDGEAVRHAIEEDIVRGGESLLLHVEATTDE